MNPERFRQIEELYYAAREGTSEERAALLAQSDPELRGQVEALLATNAGGGFLNQPAVQNAPELLGDSTVTGVAVDTLVGPYRIEGKLGEGGMGEVFRAVDTRLGRAVAIKFAYARFNARFEREARAISSLNHPSICTLYDIGPNYLVMELLAGETIAARLKKGPLPADQAVRYAAQIASALAEAHAHGIVHRDLKPGNIMLVKSGVKVLDFGLATWEGDDTLTGTNMVIGTPGYMAPEQRAGKPSDVRTDIYAFGCILYEMLTGERTTADRKSLPSKSLERIVSRCLETEPSRRWQSSVELASVLEAPTVPEKKQIPMAVAGMVAAALLAALAAAGYFYFRPSPALKEKYTVVLADFINNTNDTSFDGTLRQTLATQLESVPFLKVMDDDQVHRALPLMMLSPDARLAKPVAQELCVRQGAAASIDGAIASLGKNFAITLNAIACENGATLAREQAQADDKEHVVKALETATTRVRDKLAASLGSIPKPKHPLEQVTTRSLEALRAYTEAHFQLRVNNFLGASQLFQHATELDPQFAMAFNYIGITADNAGDTPRFRLNVKKAYRLMEPVSVFERASITPMYYQATGEMYKEVDAFLENIGRYPDYWAFHNQLSAAYIDLGRFNEALKEALEASRLAPKIETPYRRILDSYMCLKQLPQARELAKKLKAQDIPGPRVHQRFLELAYIDENQSAMNTEVQWFDERAEKYIGLGLQAAYLNLHGRRRESQEMYKRAADQAQRREYWKYTAVELEDASALAAALTGDCEDAIRRGRPVLALAVCGDEAGVKARVAEMDQLFPDGIIWQKVQHPAIRAVLALNHNRPAEGIAALASAAEYEKAYPEAVYYRGMAYLQQNNAAAAVSEFQKIVDNKGATWAVAWRYPYQGQFYALSQVGLARGFKKAGDLGKAKKAYKDFLDLWNHADKDIPLYQEAQAEYDKLP